MTGGSPGPPVGPGRLTLGSGSEGAEPAGPPTPLAAIPAVVGAASELPRGIRISWFGRPAHGFGPFLRVGRSPTSPYYMLPMLLVVGLTLGFLASVYGEAPLPPGVDPGHWLSASYAYVGLPTAPDPTNQPLYYSPLIFPLLGGLVVLLQSPAGAAFLFAELLFLFFGLSSIHLARRFLLSGPLQVLTVGAAVLCGSTIQMMFWGGYPNLLAFILMNEAMVFLLAFLRSGSVRDGALFYSALTATYFAHELSFVVLIVAAASVAFFLLVFHKVRLGFLFGRVNLSGLAAMAAVIGAYAGATSLAGIAHPSYLSANPGAFTIDEVGEIFRPLGRAPAYFPSGPALILSSHAALLILLGVPFLLLVGLGIAQGLRPDRVDSRLLVAGGWLSGAMVIPAVGFLAHVDTDYTRFVYYFPLPAALFAIIAVERTFQSSLLGTVLPLPPTPGAVPDGPRFRWRRATAGSATFLTSVAVGVVLVGLAGTVTLPTATHYELSATSQAHDQQFLSAASFLKGAQGPGGVFTVPGAARWTEALSNRETFTVGPVWLLFSAFQIANTQETYWALTSQDAVTNNHVVLSYSGFATSVLSQAPMYTVYENGVPFPVVRVLPGSIAVEADAGNGTQVYPAMAGVRPTLSVPGPTPESGVITYRTPVATLVETSEIVSNDSAAIEFLVEPEPGASVSGLQFSLASSQGSVPILESDSVTSLGLSGATLDWSVSGYEGQLPDLLTVPSTLTFSEPPTSVTRTPLLGPSAWTLAFPDPNASRPFLLRLTLATPGADNPTHELPSLMDSGAFVVQQGIRYVLWPNSAYEANEVAYYEAEFGFRPVYSNPEWIVLAH